MDEVPRLVLQRNVPMVPCAFANMEDKWRRRIDGCGELVPYRPKWPCPACGHRLIPSHATDPPDGARIIEGNVAIVDADTEEVVAVHMVCASDLASSIGAELRRVKFEDEGFTKATTAGRLSGLAIAHVTFGFAAPVPMRRRYGCSRSHFNWQYPKAWDEIQQFTQRAEHVFHEHAPDVYDHTVTKVRELIPAAWTIAGTPWTGGIVNRTAALPYHVDKSNVSGSWSAMLVCRKHVEGGLLHLADYNTYLAVPHGSITIFDGQSVVHGVTPLQITHPGGHRFSLVTYAKSAMRCCAPNPEDEAKRAALLATAAEDKRIDRPRPEREAV